MQAELRERAARQAAFCRVFANTSRILILWALQEGEKSVSDLAETLGMSLQSTSQHLGLMKTCGLLEARRDGQMVFYRIAGHGRSHSCHLVAESCQQLAESEDTTLSEKQDEHSNR